VATQHFIEPAHVSRHGLHAFVSRVAHHWVNRQMSRFIAISEAAKAAMLARGEGAEDTISVVPNGMPLADPARFASAEKIRAELGIAPGAPLIVSVARLEREKSIETLIAAMRDVVAGEPSAVCVIAGDGAQKAALLSQIAASGLERAVRLIGFRNDALALMHAAAVFVLPSPAEPFGLVLIEAMSVGKPVIATRAGGPLEIVVEGETGLLVAPSAAEEMGRAILSLVRDADLRQRMGVAGHARFLEKFTVERMTRATIAAYERALAK
jgi:glycosyltransferase involved in cell wall biosynthesis